MGLLINLFHQMKSYNGYQMRPVNIRTNLVAYTLVL